jgi:hypothetical protein
MINGLHHPYRYLRNTIKYFKVIFLIILQKKWSMKIVMNLKNLYGKLILIMKVF